MKTKDKRIAETILRAQNASDGGKSIDDLVKSKRSKHDNFSAYGVKDKLINQALQLILSGGTSFRFAVKVDIHMLYYPYVIYFETKINGEKFQVSFHSANKEFSKFLERSFRIKWDEKDSRLSAAVIYKYYCKNGTYGPF